MWWEAVPSFAVIAVCMGLYPMVTYAVNQIQFGTAYRRQMVYLSDAQLFLRDERISGSDNAYVQKGLENIPDEGDRSRDKLSNECKCE